MDGIPVHNKRKTTCPLKVALADGRRVTSTHMCDIIIPGLPTTLIGLIVPELSIASLFGIRVLTEAGCTVKFDIEKCVVEYKGKTILTGMKDPTTDLWTLPIVGSAHKTHPVNTYEEQDKFEPLRGELMERENAACGATTSSLAVPLRTGTKTYTMGGTENYELTNPPPNEFVFFTHTVQTKANSIKFAHQLMSSPTILTLLKGIRRGYLAGCPNLSANGVTRYLNPSPATAKGHMKRPHQGIRSTTAKQPNPIPAPSVDNNISPASIADDEDWMDNISEPSIQAGQFNHGPAVLVEDDDSSIGNIFCFAAFADKQTGVMYNDLTGAFPYMSLEGNVCYLIVYHYESNAILALPISGFNDNTVFAAYKTQFEFLESKGFKIRLNVMDNQCTQQIKKFITKKECKLMLIEPHNHRVNAADRATQTYKDHFISALATTDSEFPLQLWDRLTPQVETALNLMRPSRSNPNISAYEEIWGLYDWNAFPLAPPGCKAVIDESPEARGSWGSRGTDAWYLGPSHDHYQCNHYFVPETRAYCISGSAELFPQHCQVPFLSTNEHMQELTNEVVSTLKTMTPKKQRKVITLVQAKLANMNVHPEGPAFLSSPCHAWMLPNDNIQQVPQIQIRPPTQDQQRVAPSAEQRVGTTDPSAEQRVGTTPTIKATQDLRRISNAPPIMNAPNPTTKRALKTTKRVHMRRTRNNIPGTVPLITPAIPQNTVPPDDTATPVRRSPRRSTTAQRIQAAKRTKQIPKIRFVPIKGRLRNHNIISRQAINFLTDKVWHDSPQHFTPKNLRPKEAATAAKFEHLAMPMVHPTTGKTISSYKKLMNDPATKEIWQTAFGKDFGGMAQGDNKTGQKGTNAIFVMTHKEIRHIPTDRTITYARVVVDFRPQKADPHRIRITAGGNLINYPGELTTRTADLTTSKLMWNSVLSTDNAKYMCLDIKNFYLTANLDRYEYMKIPMSIFPAWTKEQYNLDKHAKNGFVYIEMRRAVWGLPQAGILANKLLRKRLLPHGYYECKHTPGLWRHLTRPISFTLVVDDFGVKYVGREHVDHLIKCIKEKYELTEDWSGDLYCGIKLHWDYIVRTVDISMPGYIKKLLQKYKHKIPTKPQHCPYTPAPKQYGAEPQAPLPIDISPKLSNKEIKDIQRIV